MGLAEFVPPSSSPPSPLRGHLVLHLNRTDSRTPAIGREAGLSFLPSYPKRCFAPHSRTLREQRAVRRTPASWSAPWSGALDRWDPWAQLLPPPHAVAIHASG